VLLAKGTFGVEPGGPLDAEQAPMGRGWGMLIRREKRGRQPLRKRLGAGARMILGGAGLLGTLLGCEPPDVPPIRSQGLPSAVLEYVVPDRVSTFRVGDGVVYRSLRSAVQPWTLHLLEVDAGRCEVGFQVAAAGSESPRASVTELARRNGGEVVAAVNGDFFTEENLPIGLEASAGEVRGRSARPVFAWRPGSLPQVGPVQWSGDSLSVGAWALSVREPDGVTEILSGFPVLLAEGRWVDDLQQESRPGFAAARHPRTALGWDPSGQRVWLAVVEGRREGSAEGMTLPELATFLQALGVTDALNLDGGGSSVMIVKGKRVSRTSDPGGERSVVNALLVRVDPAWCEPDPLSGGALEVDAY
jgi:uncharacterized protein YigE (DUF2233 family)